MKALSTILLLLGLTAAEDLNVRYFDSAEEIIRIVNGANTTWKAGHNFPPNTPMSYFSRLLGARLGYRPAEARVVTWSQPDKSNQVIPKNFDARKKWKKCSYIRHIRDQGDCGSCWAVAAASAFNDRVCIFKSSQDAKHLMLAGEDLLACCGSSCGFGCNGGYPYRAWFYFHKYGTVTGGDYNSKKGCQPYELEPCEHHTNGSRPQCSSLQTPPTPECRKKCTNSEYKRPIEQDRHKSGEPYFLSDSVTTIQRDILAHGPVEAAFHVYDDFLSYKKGVYYHRTGEMRGGHAVKVIGWGEEHGTPYWLVANSWNSDWGDHGLFKIRRGQDDCSFESAMTAAEVQK